MESGYASGLSSEETDEQIGSAEATRLREQGEAREAVGGDLGQGEPARRRARQLEAVDAERAQERAGRLTAGHGDQIGPALAQQGSTRASQRRAGARSLPG